MDSNRTQLKNKILDEWQAALRRWENGDAPSPSAKDYALLTVKVLVPTEYRFAQDVDVEAIAFRLDEAMCAGYDLEDVIMMELL